MMARVFNRVGVWLTVVAVVLYVASGIALDVLRKNHVAQAKSMHAEGQQISMGEVKQVRINGIGKPGFVPIKVHFSSNSNNAEIQNSNLAIISEGKIVDDVLAVSVTNPNGGMYEQFSPIDIQLPSTVNQLDIGGVKTVSVDGHFSQSDMALNIRIVDCEPKLQLQNLSLSRLGIITSCPPSDAKAGSAGDVPLLAWQPLSVSIGAGVALVELKATMPTGHLFVDRSVVPGKITLEIGEPVLITANAAFLSKAIFSTRPDAGMVTTNDQQKSTAQSITTLPHGR